jgi:hypothetical protein
MGASTPEGRLAIRRQMQQQMLEERRAIERQVAEEDERGRQAIGRLKTMHPRPETARKDLLETHEHAMRQWGTGKGVVGPTGSEGWFPWFNRPHDATYELDQQFGYHHDMQATDAFKQYQDGTSDNRGRGPGGNANDQDTRRVDYNAANRNSAIQGMWILRKTGDLDKALRATQQTFKNFGFDVKPRY